MSWISSIPGLLCLQLLGTQLNVMLLHADHLRRVFNCTVYYTRDHLRCDTRDDPRDDKIEDIYLTGPRATFQGHVSYPRVIVLE
jgi:hypothetical protein